MPTATAGLLTAVFGAAALARGGATASATGGIDAGRGRVEGGSTSAAGDGGGVPPIASLPLQFEASPGIREGTGNPPALDWFPPTPSSSFDLHSDDYDPFVVARELNFQVRFTPN